MNGRSLQLVGKTSALGSTRGLEQEVRSGIIARVESDEGARIGRLAHEFGIGYDVILQVIVEHAEEKAERRYKQGYRDGRNTWLPPSMAKRAA